MYDLNEGAKLASGLQIMRNFENATKTAGGTVQGTYPDWCKACGVRPSSRKRLYQLGRVDEIRRGRQRNLGLYAGHGRRDGYGIQIIERQAMKQDIVVDAATLQQGLAETGHIAVYDILFDTGKSDIKPESEPLKEIAKLMSQNPSLKLHVVGHTDNVGDLQRT